MNEYKLFSYYYDEVMSSLDYNMWYQYTKKYLKPNDKILDLACGTGTLLHYLANDYDSYGLDLSSECIEIAKEKAKINHLNINFIVSDMLTFKYNHKFNVITCYFDSINFLDKIDKVNSLIKHVYDNLEDNGYFIFDIFNINLYNQYINTYYKEDYETFKLKWKTKKGPNKSLKHSIKIKDNKATYKEIYNEYYYDINNFDFYKFKVEKIDYNYFPDDERIIVVLKK